MANDKKPEGSKPTHKTQREDEQLRDEAQAETDGDAPMDPADEAFIEENRGH